MKPLRVVLADDHTLVRVGIRALLKNLATIQVVAEASDGAQAVELAKTHRPDVVLMDVIMPGLSGLEATVQLTHDVPEVKVVILSVYADEAYVVQALSAGAAGYLLKDVTSVELERAVHTVARGDTRPIFDFL